MTDNDTDKKPLHGPNLVLDVENFGPIAEAKNIEFRPMTVFVGPSNTGKSYLAMLLHAMLQTHRDSRSAQRSAYLRSLLPKAIADDFESLCAETLKLLTREGEYNSDSDVVSISIGDYSERSKKIIMDLLSQRRRDINKAYTREINDFFEVENFNDLRRRSRGISDQISIKMQDSHLDWNMGPGTDSPVAIEDFRIAFGERFVTEMKGDDDFRRTFLILGIIQALIDSLEHRFRGIHDSLYFPAARTGMLMSHRIITDGLLGFAHHASVGREVKFGATYHRVTRDFLRLTNNVVDAQRSKRLSPDFETEDLIASRIENAVLRGKVVVEEAQYGPPDFFYSPTHLDALRVPMHRASAMVTEIAPMVAFLRAYVEVGDLLIIEEPEAHLHPEAQQRMAAVLTYMVRNGIRVLMTTHSHYMVEAMGMFACAAALGDSARVRAMQFADSEFDRLLYLDEEDVAVYSFEPHDQLGTVVNPVPFDPESYAFEPEDYSTALLDQFNRVSRVVNERIDVDELAESA